MNGKFEHPEAQEYDAATVELQRAAGAAGEDLTLALFTFSRQPWTYCRGLECGPCGNLYSGHVFVGQAFGKGHAGLYPDLADKLPGVDEQLANARLMCAARKMAALLVKMVTHCPDCRGAGRLLRSNGRGNPADSFACDGCGEARAILAEIHG